MWHTIVLWAIGGVLVIVSWRIVRGTISIYNQLVAVRESIENGWRQIRNESRVRNDIVQRLYEIVKEYKLHEQDVMASVHKGRQLLKGGDDKRGGNRDPLAFFCALVEAYPELRSNELFRDLLRRLAEAGEIIGGTVQAFNNAVTAYNTSLEQFPSNVVGVMFLFAKAEYFDLANEERLALVASSRNPQERLPSPP